MGVGNRAAALGGTLLNPVARPGYTRSMPGTLTKLALLTLALAAVATASQAQTTRRRGEQRAPEATAPAAPVDKRDSTVTVSGPFNGRPYWLALAQCGGTYFKLNVLYTDAAVHARIDKPDPKANAEFTRELHEAMDTATTFFNAAERFLMSERAVERPDAVLTYDVQSRAAGERLKTVEAALTAAHACPALYRACQDGFPKQCSEPLVSKR
jgi:hypothetical protein